MKFLDPITGGVDATLGAVTMSTPLGIASGGTNSTATATANGVGYGTGTAHAYTAAGTTGQVLTATTGSAPTWAAPAGGAPSGAAGGSLGGTYPNPQVAQVNAYDTRSVATTPNDYFAVSKWAFKTSSVVGTPSGTWTALNGFRSYGDASGDMAHEYGYASDGNAYHRWGSTTTWGSWIKVGDATNANIFEGDSRLTNSRAPSGAAGGDLAGTYPNPTLGTGTIAGTRTFSGATTFSALLTASAGLTVTGTTTLNTALGIASGGTNSTATATAGGIGYGTGTAHAYSAAGTTGQYLKTGVAGAPTWASLTASDVSGVVPYGGVIMQQNAFGGNHLYISNLNNAAFRATDRWTVTGGIYNSSDNSLYSTPSQGELATQFNGDYESWLIVPVGKYLKYNINSSGHFSGYPYGYFYVSHYYTNIASSVGIRVYCNYVPQTVGWKTLTVTNFTTANGYLIVQAYNSYYDISDIEVTVTSPPSGTDAWPVMLEWNLDRPGTAQEMPILDKYRTNTLYDSLNLVSGKTYQIAGVALASTHLTDSASLMHLAGTETVTGAKTFSGGLTVSAGGASVTGGFTSVSGATFSSTLGVTGNTTLSGGTVTLNNGTSNWLNFGQNGVSPPAFTTRSAGTKLVFYDSLSGSGAGYAAGIETSTLWFSTDTTGTQFKWYGGTTLAATLSGLGAMTLVAGLTATTGAFSSTVATGALTVTGAATASTTITAGTGLTVTTGNVTASNGSVSARSSTASTGYAIMFAGDTAHTGDIEFWAINGNRSGYIGYGPGSPTTDAGTINYQAGTHAFTGAATISSTLGVTGAVSLTTALGISSGGTNSTATPTAGGAGYGTGTAHAYTAAGTAGQVLTSNGASAPTWQTASGGDAVTGSVMMMMGA